MNVLEKLPPALIEVISLYIDGKTLATSSETVLLLRVQYALEHPEDLL